MACYNLRNVVNHFKTDFNHFIDGGHSIIISVLCRMTRTTRTLISLAGFEIRHQL